MNSEITKNVESKMNKTIESLEEKLKTVRAGRANPSSLDRVTVDYYGSQTPLKHLATISVPEATQLLIKPFDKTCLKDIEKAIFESNLGYTPNNDGESIRNIRHEGLEAVKKEDLAEDEEKGIEKQIQDLVNSFNKEIDNLVKEKEQELMTV